MLVGACDFYGDPINTSSKLSEDLAFKGEPSTFPPGYMNQTDLKHARVIEMAPGDILGLISDGIYEYENPAGGRYDDCPDPSPRMNPDQALYFAVCGS